MGMYVLPKPMLLRNACPLNALVSISCSCPYCNCRHCTKSSMSSFGYLVSISSTG